MRILESKEMEFVAGGDDFDGNAVACGTVAGASVVLSGAIGGTTAGSTAGVLTQTTAEFCEAITTSVGTSIGSAAANVVISTQETSAELSYAVDSLYMAMKWLTLGL
jgi:predicted patatin/cPLA2 family phospholipase